jgi:hypothetical protein
MNPATVSVSRERLSSLPTPRLVLGNFVELGLGRQVSGMWSEMLFNRSFCTIPPATPIIWEWLRLDSPFYNARAPFWHSGYEQMDWEPLDGSESFRIRGFEPFKGNDSLGVRNARAGAETGIRQRGIFLANDQIYRFRFQGAFQGKKRTVPPELFDPARDPEPELRHVEIIFKSESSPEAVIAAHTFDILATQAPQEFEFTCRGFTGRGTVSISFVWEGVLFLSWASLMPVDNRSGWRTDVVELFRKVSPPVLRFPGGCFASFYDWRDGIGPRAARSPREPYFWGGLEENDVGIDEFLELCAMIGSEAQVCINMMTGTPYAAADLVEYCNGPVTSPMGRLRKELGINRTGRVQFWEMENEAGRKWSALQYAAHVVEYARRMRTADPSITIMMEYYSWSVDWLPRMLEIAGKDIDIVIHRDGDRPFIKKALAVLHEYNEKNGTSIRHANTEWLPDFDSPEPFEEEGVPRTYDWEPSGNDYRKILSFRQIRWFYALSAASRIIDYLSYGGNFALANFNNSVNTWGQNIINSSKEGAWLSPSGRVFEFFRDFGGAHPLATSCDPDDRSVLNMQACESSNGSIDLYMVNRGTHPISISLSLPDGMKARRMRILDAEHRLVTNVLGQDRIRYRELPAHEGMVLDPLSVTQIVIH